MKGDRIEDGARLDLPADFQQVYEHASFIPGWMTVRQAFSLYQRAKEVDGPGARIVEIGSHQGRSTVVLALAAPQSETVAIDPFIDGRMFGGKKTKDLFEANVAGAGVRGRIRLLEAKSTDLRAAWDERIDLLYIDGKHDYWTVTDDLLWSAHVPEGRTILIHDAFSSIGVTLALLRWVLPSRTLRYVDREGSLARFVVGRPSMRDRRRILREMPWWIRNVFIKVLLRLRLYPIARLAGHDSAVDPY